MARIQENALKKNPRLRILDIRIANSQPKILNQKMSPSNRIPSIQVQKFRRDPLPASLIFGSQFPQAPKDKAVETGRILLIDQVAAVIFVN